MSRPSGIATAVMVPLGIFVVSCMLLAVGLFFSLREIATILDLSATRKMPALIATAALTRECEWMRGMTFRMIGSDNELVLKSGLVELREHITTTKDIMSQLEQIGLYQQALASIREQVTSLDDIAGRLEQAVAASLALNVRQTRLVKNLRSLSAELEDLDARYPQNAPLLHWSHHMHMSLSLLLVLCADVDSSYGMRVTTELATQIEQARQSMTHFDAVGHPNDRELLIAAQGITNRMLICAQSEKGVLPLFRDAHELRQSLDALCLHINALSDAVTRAADGLFMQARQETFLTRDALDAQMKSLLLWLVVFLGFAVLVMGCTCGYLSCSVIRPVIALNRCMRLRTQGTRTPLPHGGAGEIQEMSESVAFFINRIEEREEELRCSRDSLEQLVQERTAELSRLSRRLLQTQEEERFRLAAELHDDIGSTISVIKFGIERALILLRQQEQEKIAQAQEPLDEAVKLVKGLARQLRRIQRELRPAYLDLGLQASLQMFCQDYQATQTDLHVVLHTDFDETILATPVRVVIFRLVQEALNNVAKHSHASEVRISVACTESSTLTACIQDTGDGFDPASSSNGLGLKSMRERVELSGGAFSLCTAPGQGVTICAEWHL